MKEQQELRSIIADFERRWQGIERRQTDAAFSDSQVSKLKELLDESNERLLGSEGFARRVDGRIDAATASFALRLVLWAAGAFVSGVSACAIALLRFWWKA